MTRKKTTWDQVQQLRKLIFAQEPIMGKEIARQVGVSPLVVTYYKTKWGVNRKKRKSVKKQRVIKGTEFMGKKPQITAEMTTLIGIQKLYNHLSMMDKAAFVKDIEKWVAQEKDNINSLSL